MLKSLDRKNLSNLTSIGEKTRGLINKSVLPEEIKNACKEAYHNLCKQCSIVDLDVAVRSSATAEDLPTASFAGRIESFLNISGVDQVLDAIHRCYISLFTDRAIKYRLDMGFMDMDIALSAGVQQMVRSEKASSGVAFTIDPDSGFKNTIVINSIWGLGENIVQGRVTPDEWTVFKPMLKDKKYNPILRSHCGQKEFTVVYADKTGKVSAENTIINYDISKEKK